MDTTGLSSPPSLCAQFSGAVGTPSLVAAGQRLRGGVPDGGHGQRLVWVSFCGGRRFLEESLTRVFGELASQEMLSCKHCRVGFHREHLRLFV